MQELWAGGPIYADDPAFKISMDSILLANFAQTGTYERCMDLGCGGGLISVLLAAARPDAVYDSLDVRSEAVDVCRTNYRANAVRGGVACADMRDHRSLGEGGNYDLVVCNPPYYYGSKPSPDPARAASRGGSLSPAQFCGAAGYLLKKGGEFCLVHKPEFLADIFAAMRLADIEPKRLRMVCHKARSAPSLILVAGRRGGRPGLATEPVFVLCEDDGSPTEETRRVYRR